MILASDFRKGNYCFSTKTTLWGKNDVFVMVHYDGHEGEEDAFLSAIIHSIGHRLEWIESNRPFLETVLMENRMMEQTEEWIRKANDAEEIEKGAVYALKGGERVSLPLKKDAFLSGLSVVNMEIDYQEDERKPRTDLFIHCKPDYFMGFACIQVVINHDDTIEECDLLCDSSPDKPWDL